MVWFRENWYEEVLRQLRLGLAKCYNIAFDSRGSVADSQITPHTFNFIKKLVSTFGIGIGNFGYKLFHLCLSIFNTYLCHIIHNKI